MNFIEAMRTGLPMRRQAWTKHPPIDTDSAEGKALAAVMAGGWIFYAVAPTAEQSPWIIIGTGQRFAIRRACTLADDWEVLDSQVNQRAVDQLRAIERAYLARADELAALREELETARGIIGRACTELEDTGGEFAIEKARELLREAGLEVPAEPAEGA